jgi:hypothetical protein
MIRARQGSLRVQPLPGVISAPLRAIAVMATAMTICAWSTEGDWYVLTMVSHYGEDNHLSEFLDGIEHEASFVRLIIL